MKYIVHRFAVTALMLIICCSSCDKHQYIPHQPELLLGSGAPGPGRGAPGDFYLDTENQDLYGPKGEKDWGEPVSLIGATGPKGTPGSVIINGTGVPGASDGRDGDYYLDKEQALLYGPKTAGGWGEPVSLKGPAGSNGTNGNTILSGPSAPLSTQGVIGDFYLNTTTLEFYGPKTAAGWGTPINVPNPGSGCDLVLPAVSFKASSTQISSDNEAILASVANTLRTNTGCKVVVKGGYCGDNQQNLQLSWRRVNAVISYLVQEQGISGDRFIFKYNQPGSDCGIVELQSGAPGEPGGGVIPPMP
ncbi:OmpA family protein [Niabella beijingensis]|uniref:OmpA family protein n=1 Tax=Niabella beijingensis TaxID=2872700 RepID=UPI001CC18687|nr:OmpA family protein [Niabella beijingensis]MBZ4189859.1 OmpA family protein [Niabella beijingensis]